MMINLTDSSPGARPLQYCSLCLASHSCASMYKPMKLSSSISSTFSCRGSGCGSGLLSGDLTSVCLCQSASDVKCGVFPFQHLVSNSLLEAEMTKAKQTGGGSKGASEGDAAFRALFSNMCDVLLILSVH